MPISSLLFRFEYATQMAKGSLALAHQRTFRGGGKTKKR